MPIQVLVVEDHHIVRDGLKLLLERAGFKVTGEAADGHAAIRVAAELQPDVAILDIGLPLLNGLDTARAILKLCPRTRVIFLSMAGEKQYVLEGLRLGAKGFVNKAHASEQLVRAIREAVRGKMLLTAEVAQALAEAYQSDPVTPADPLTMREKQVLQLVAEGKTTKEIASILNVSVKTAETHRAHTMQKLDIHETAGLVRYAIRRGLIEP